MINEGLELVISFIHGVTDPIIVTDVYFHISYINASAEQLFGYTLSEVKGLSPEIFNVDDEASGIQSELYLKVSMGQTYTGRALNRRKDGSTFKNEFTVMPIKSQEGTTYAYMALLKDITEYEEALIRTGAEAVKQYIDHAPMGIFVMDNFGKVLSANHSALHFTECSAKGAIKCDVFEIFYADDCDNAKEKFKLFEQCGTIEDTLHISMNNGQFAYWRLSGRRVNANELIVFVQDISELQEAIFEAHQTKELHRILLDTIPTMVWYLTDPCTYGIVNQAFAEFRGKSKAYFPGKTYYDVYPKHIAKDYMASNQQVFSTGETVMQLTYVPDAKDQMHILQVTKSAHYNAEGKIAYIVCSANDVTEQYRAEQLLKENEERFRHLVQNSSDIIEILDYTGKILYVSDQVETILGYPKDEVLSKNAFDNMHPDDLSHVAQLFTEGILQPGVQMEVSYRYRHIDGHYVHLHAIGSNYLHDPVINGIVLNIRDITATKIAELELQKAMEIVENMDLGIHVYHLDDLNNDHTLRMIYANRASERLTGVKKEEVLEKTLDESFPLLREIGIPQRYAQVVKSQTAMVFEDLTYGDNRIVTSAFSVKAFPLPGQQVAVCFENITSRKHMEEELIETRDAALRANLAKSQFLAHMSHEIRTPLNGIIGFTDLLLQTPLSPVQQSYCENVNLSGNSLLGIINDVLDLSKIEAGKLELNVSEVEIRAIIQEVSEMIRYPLESKGLKFQMNIQPRMPSHFVADPIRLKQILINLLSNAIKFTEHGSVAFILEFVDLSDEDGHFGRFTFSVTDTGIGMSKEQLKKLFLPFSQADHSITRRFGGTGLGLAISRHLAEKMGTKISVESKEGMGSVFSLTIETTWSDESFEKASSDVRNIGTLSQKSDSQDKVTQASTVEACICVLVVDDVPTNLMLISALVRKIAPNAIILEASNGHEALQLFDGNVIDIVMMDVQMPEMDGLEATRRLRIIDIERKCHTPIFGLSAGALEEERMAAFESGMDGYLTKPINRQALLEVFMRFR